MPRVPLAAFWEAQGATIKKDKDWEIPSLFKDFASECEAVRKGVGLVDLSSRGKIEVTGKDRVAFLHNLLTNDIKSLGIGTGCYSALLNAQGRVLGDMNVYAAANSFFLETEPGLEPKLISLLEKHRINEEVTFKNVTEDWILITLQGPKSEALVGALIFGPISVSREFDHVNAVLLDTPFTLIRRSVTGENGFHFLIPKEKGEPIAKRVLEVGNLYGLRPVGWGAFEILRIEAGVPRYGIDMDETVALPETGLEAMAASNTKGCYPGQEVVARTATYGGLQRKLCGLVFDKAALPKSGDKVMKDKEEIGWVTSACHSPTLLKGIALAYLKKSFWESGQAVSIQSSPVPIPARISPPLPFLDKSS